MWRTTAMPQLHLYVSEPVAKALRERAEAEGMSVSRYLAAVVNREIRRDWPERFFTEVVGGWKGKPLERPPQGKVETRETM
jgi:hypothetical protein